MAKKKSQSEILKRIKEKGGAKAWDAHKDDPTTVGAGGDLPSGIDGGVAELVTAELGEYNSGSNKGEPRLFLAGVVQEPQEYRGCRTSKNLPLCETSSTFGARTFDENFDRAMNEVRKLGIVTAQAGFDDIPDLLSSLQDEKPHFRFRTWSTEGSDFVNHDWRGVAEGYESNGAPEDAVDEDVEYGAEEDATPTTTTAEPTVLELGAAADDGDEEAAASIGGQARIFNIDPDEYETWAEVAQLLHEAREAEPTDDDSSSDDSGDDLTALGEAADADDEDAQATLSDKAEAAGVDTDAYETWAEVAEAIESGGDNVTAPEKEEVYMFKPPRARKAVEVQVTAVFDGKQTCNVRELETSKTHKGVAWASLQPSDE